MRSRNGTGQIAPCWVCSRHSSSYGEGYLSRYLESDTLKKKFNNMLQPTNEENIRIFDYCKSHHHPITKWNKSSPDSVICIGALSLVHAEAQRLLRLQHLGSIISKVYFRQRWYLHLKCKDPASKVKGSGTG